MKPVARVLAAVVAVLLLAAACAGEDVASETDLVVDLRDFSIAFGDATVSAGATTIGVRNRGSTAHDLIILRTDSEPDRLPVEGATAKEEGRVAGTRMLSPGAVARLTVDLQPGAYVWICNVPGHYTLGMRTKVVVR
jgi:uncharacterized cupredoxin-like copper-binding protein